MSGNFLKFKKRRGAIRTFKAIMAGTACGLALGGVWLLLSKLAVIGFEPISSLFVGIGAALVVGVVFFLLGRKSDKAFAEELDLEFDLKARVQTMVEYRGEDGELITLQRQDTESALSGIPIKEYKFKKLWIYILAIVLSAAVLVVGLAVDNMRDYVPPEEIIPFELTVLQEAGINELIKYVEDSKMENEFKTPIADELRTLILKLKKIHTQPEMQVALAETMAVIVDVTYKSSTATEMLNALWDSEDTNLRYLAKTLDTSSWSVPDWGDFAEKLTEYIAILMGDFDKSTDAVVGAQRLKWAVDSMMRKLDIVLDASKLSEDDEMYAAVNSLFRDETNGLSLLLNKLDSLSDDEAREALVLSLDAMSESVYEAISLNRVNAYVGEYAMTRLSSLFLVPIPEFERPEFVKNNESVDGTHMDSEDNNKENNGNSGGIGEGATFGSDDLVLDPLTGKLVKIGDLIHRYYALMFEKLEGDSYTDEQKEIIKNYFDLLYSGIEKEDGK